METILLSIRKKELKEIISESIADALQRNSPPPVSAPENMTRKQAASYLQCSTMQLYRLSQKEILKPSHLGGKIIYRKSELDNFLNEKNR